MTCAECDARFDAWLAGTLPEAEARAMEAHAAECAACEARLDAASRVPVGVPAEIAPPPAVRDAVLREVRGRRARRRWGAWIVLAGGATAAALLLITLRPREKRASDVPDGAAWLLAAERAKASFTELDGAERELQAALQAHPDDRDAAERLELVRRMRRALQHQIRESTS